MTKNLHMHCQVLRARTSMPRATHVMTGAPVAGQRLCMAGAAPDDLQEEVAVLPDVSRDEAVQQARLALRRVPALRHPALPVLPLRRGPAPLPGRPPL